MERKPIRAVVSNFDFLGLFCIVGGVVLVLIGFQGAENGSWQAAQTIAPLCVGVVLLLAGAVNEFFTKKDAIIPARLFRTRTTAGILISVFIHALVFFTATYYIPLYFQILGSSATGAGVRQLPLSLGSALTAIVSGIVVVRTGRYRPSLWFGFTIMTLGVGLLIMFEEDTSVAKQEIFLLICALGFGCVLQAPLIGLQAAMPLKNMATSIAALNLLRTLGGAVGIAVGDTVFATELPKRLAKISGYDKSSTAATTSGDYASLSHIEPESLRQQVLHAYTRSLATIYIVSLPITFVGLLCVLVVREYTLKRNIHRGGKDEAPAVDTKTNAESTTSDYASQQPSSSEPVK